MATAPTTIIVNRPDSPHSDGISYRTHVLQKLRFTPSTGGTRSLRSLLPLPWPQQCEQAPTAFDFRWGTR